LVDVLEPLSTEEKDWLAQRTIERSFQKGNTVYAPGDASEVVFLLLAGRIRLYGMAREQELTYEMLQAGTVFGVASLMERTQDEYAMALGPSRVGLVGLNTFWRLVRQNPEVNARLVKLLGERLRLSRSRTTNIALKEVPARLASLILDLIQSEGVVTREGNYKVPCHYTHEQLASMIGAKRVAVTRAFGKLQDAGCVRLWRRQIYVVDLAALRQFATAR
jgi:CRP/FNR family cyclic AMP-dependent transcriptional regulator